MCFTCMLVHHVLEVHTEVRRWIGFPETQVTNDYGPPCGCCETNSIAQQEQQMPLIIEPSTSPAP